MVHLFDKVYLEITPKIDIHKNRIVISKERSRYTPDKLLFQYDSIENLLSSTSFSDFIESVYFHSKTKGSEIVIYCDDISILYSTFCKHIFPNMSLDTYKDLITIINYNRQVHKKEKLFDISKSQSLWDIEVLDYDVQKIKSLGLSFSYEFLFANYLSGSDNYLDLFLKKFHHFLRGWYSECFTDNREMVLINLFNHKFQEQLSFSEKDFDIQEKNLLKNIPRLKYYADEEIWFRDGTENINLSGLSEEKSKGLVDLIFFVYSNCEGMETDRSSFGLYKWIRCATDDHITKEKMDEIINYISEHTFDTSAVPRKKFEIINYPLILKILSYKRTKNLNKLLEYRLI